MKELIFKNEFGLAGRFATVRLGADLGYEKDETIRLIGGISGEVLGYARVADLWVGDLALIPASILEMEQAPLSRFYSGLITWLRIDVASGPGKKMPAPVKPDDKVTAIILDFSNKRLVL